MANNSEKIIVDDSLDLSDHLLYQLAATMEQEHDVHTDRKENEDEEKEEQQQHLSQKFSQLTASQDDQQHEQSKSKRSSHEGTSIIPKRMKMDDQPTKDQIPDYLSINHLPFQQLIQSITSTARANTITMQDWQDIALLIRHITMVDLQKALWNTYLQSGTGKLSTTATHRPSPELFLWPIEMKSMMMMRETGNKIDTSDDITRPVDHTACLDYVQRTLQELADRQLQYQIELEKKKHVCKNFFTSEIANTIRQYIERYELVFVRLDFESKMAIVNFDYQDRLLERKYHQLKPNPYQLNLFEHLPRLKHEKEKMKYEVELLKQRLHRYHCLLEPLNSLQLPIPSSASLEKIIDPTMRQHLLDSYTRVVEQTKLEMMKLSITIAEVQMHECQAKFDQDIVQMNSPDRPLSQSMVQIIEQRFRNTDERLEYLYNAKIHYLQAQTIRRKHQHAP